MGMYTELHFNAQLAHNTPQVVLDVLACMTDPQATTPAELPDHELFGTRHWESMLQCDSSYFPLTVASSIDHEYGRHYLRVRSNFKNYDGEVEKFLDWVMPWVDADTECLGYHRYEEDDHPTLIYKTAPTPVAELIEADVRRSIAEEIEADRGGEYGCCGCPKDRDRYAAIARGGQP